MKVIAKTIKGREFMYNPRSARKVSARSAEMILKVVNDFRFQLSGDNETWHIYNIDKYDTAFIYAQNQAFTIRNGIVTARCY